ncbi:VanZ family protein [Neobacillus sp. D3-1R]|uniref:VanZ family protein n=1 Tax=Neobacillus sp. D3-1R TaxID=3445778 RepID=UPI003F9FB892
MRIVLIMVWAGFIFLSTCNSSFPDLLEHQQISFHWTFTPSFEELLYPLPTEDNPYFTLQKIGHALSFFILALLVMARFPSKIQAFILCFSYAVLTEILQLFFMRDGRLFDIGFDSIGILSAIILMHLVWKITKKKSWPI